MTACFNYHCLCRPNESKPPYECECVACPNRITESQIIIMGNRTLVQKAIKLQKTEAQRNEL